MSGVTFRLSSASYHAIMDDKAVLLSLSRQALEKAVPLPDAWRVVDVAEGAAQNIEDWFTWAAGVESQRPKRDVFRLTILETAIRAIHDGRAKSRREQRLPDPANRRKARDDHHHRLYPRLCARVPKRLLTPGAERVLPMQDNDTRRSVRRLSG
jgi:hypothetical protein